jgi:hypothetical protein
MYGVGEDGIVLLPLVENTVMAATLYKVGLQDYRLDQGGKKPCLPRIDDVLLLGNSQNLSSVVMSYRQ